jgi:tripartite-type tricarboxylate transporter receptor subunit TctC
MKLPRRTFVHLAAGVAVLPMASRIARAQSYPTRPVRIIIGFPAGTTADTVARLLGQWLSERLGQPFLIEDRPGAASTIATEVVVRAPADGHTLLCITPANPINTAVYDKLNYDFLRDIVPIAGISRGPLVMVVNPSIPAKTVPEFIAYAKANSGNVHFGSGGIGSLLQFSGELFKRMAGVDLVHVPFRGSAPAITALLGEQVQVVFDTMGPSIENIRAGKLRALAVTTMTRSEALPDIPTVSEFVPGYEVSLFLGIGAPKSTPGEVIDRLNREINTGLAHPKIKARLADVGSAPLVLSPAPFGRLIADETEKWGKVIRAANIKPE